MVSGRRLTQLITILMLLGTTFAAAPRVEANTDANVKPFTRPDQPPPPPTPVPGEQPVRDSSSGALSDVWAAGIQPPSNATALAVAMGIAPSAVASASLGTSDLLGVGIGNAPLGAFFPTQSSTFVILSTGLAASADQPNAEENLGYTLGGLNNLQGNDMVQLKLSLHVPSTAKCARFDFAFYTEEYPESVKYTGHYNDAFTAEIGGTNLSIVNNQVTSPLNFAFDSSGKPISVNTVLGIKPGTGTTYDGGTGMLRAHTPVSPGSTTMFVFTIQDVGDSIYDSAVFIDKFAWGSTTCTKGVSLVTYGLSVKSAGPLDGWILESGENTSVGGSMDGTSTALYLGDDAGDKQYRSILSFNTAPLPDAAVITSAKLKMRKFQTVGSDPFGTLGNIIVDIRKGSFSGNGALQIGDFEAAPSLNAAFTIANVASSTGWYSKALPSTSVPYINKSGLTQLRLRFAKDDNDNHIADYLLFYSGDASPTANRPLLNILYH